MNVLRTLACTLLLSCAEDERTSPRWQPAFDAGALWLVDVSASPAGEQWWAVGGTEEQGVLLDGSRGFAPVEIGAVPLLHWVHTFSSQQAIAVGKRGALLRLDEGGWQLEQLPTEQDLWGVWGAQPDDVWVVGGDGQAEGHATVLHWDGSAWSHASLPALQRPHVWAWYKVWGSSRNDVYIVGQSGGALHFDGESFHELGLGTAEDLIAVWGTARDRVAVVGGRSSGLLATFDGERWRTSSLAPLPGLNGVWMGDRDTIHVAGIEGTLAHVDFASHATTREPLATPSRLVFHALHGAGGQLLAVGGNLGSSVPPYRSLAQRRALSEKP
jgi:hypothetical protein